MKSKGFTLIELLAVIVILAIIALIATPIVLGIIEDSRENTDKVSAQYIVDMVEKAYSIAYTDNMGVTPTLNKVKEAFEMNGARWEIREINDVDTHVIVTPEDAVVCTETAITSGEDAGKIKFVCKLKGKDEIAAETSALTFAEASETTETETTTES